MTGLEIQKNQELEMAKLKLSDTKHMRSETQNKIQQLQAEHEMGVSQHQKKIKNLNNIEATQYLKITKLGGDITNAENVLHSRQLEHNTIVKIVKDNQVDLNATKEETETMILDFEKKCAEIEDEIKSSYLQIQTDKDMEVLLEVCQNILNDPNKLPYLHDTYYKRRQAIYKRRQDLNQELRQLERTQNALGMELKAKQEELAALKEKNATLTNLYVRTRKLKRGH